MLYKYIAYLASFSVCQSVCDFYKQTLNLQTAYDMFFKLTTNTDGYNVYFPMKFRFCNPNRFKMAAILIIR